VPESTAAIELVELRAEVGDFLGRGRGEAYGDRAWAPRVVLEVASCINSGLHKFYYPPVLSGEATAHSWSFLKPTTTITLEEGWQHLILPGDFGGLEGDVAVASPTGTRWAAVPVVGSGMIDRMRAQADDQTGPPRAVAIRPIKGTGPKRGQGFALDVYPAADQDYDLKLAYTLAPDVLTAEHPYPYGGPVHRETILESCLAVAEGRRDDMRQGTGPHSVAFLECLRASISHDRKFQPKALGYNGDRRVFTGDLRHDNRLVTFDDSYST
jgi:hypothetical protein